MKFQTRSHKGKLEERMYYIPHPRQQIHPPSTIALSVLITLCHACPQHNISSYPTDLQAQRLVQIWASIFSWNNLGVWCCTLWGGLHLHQLEDDSIFLKIHIHKGIEVD
jgi:hypothetical protein